MAASNERSRENKTRRIKQQVLGRGKDSEEVISNFSRQYREFVSRGDTPKQRTAFDDRNRGKGYFLSYPINPNTLTGAPSVEEDRNVLASILSFVLQEFGKNGHSFYFTPLNLREIIDHYRINIFHVTDGGLRVDGLKIDSYDHAVVNDIFSQHAVFSSPSISPSISAYDFDHSYRDVKETIATQSDELSGSLKSPDKPIKKRPRSTRGRRTYKREDFQ